MQFIKSAEGVDWYESQKLFEEDKLKIVFDSSTGRIHGLSMDITALWPLDSSVADVDFDVNTKMEDLKDKIFDVSSGKIKDRVYSKAELRTQAEQKINTLKSEASSLITPLQYAKDLDMATEEELSYLSNLQKYFVYLNRVPTQTGYPRKIEWPILPTE